MNNYNTILQTTIFDDIENEKKSILKYIKTNKSFKIPEIIKNNLKYNLRNYQKNGLENFIFMNNPNNNDNIIDILQKYNSKNNHYLFHMATGSGKTMLMAATIIYLYNLGYKKFIFTTNQTNLISKTKLNLLPNLKSSKCEFKNKFIEIDGKKIQIKEVSNFNKYSNDIEILFTTIHNLHNKINETKENSINLNDIKNQDIIILADEAHHFQSNSKSKIIQEDNKSWEESINKLLNINTKNKLVEFTATMDLLNSNILEKYKDKLIFDYTLKKFREDGYSKEISLIQDNNKENRIISSILINQYRYEISIKNKINIIPKILFKASGTIEDLEKEQENILNLISNLSIQKLNEILNNSNISYIFKLKKYLKTNLKKELFLSLIKKQFNINSSLIIHSNDKNKDEKLKIANNLDTNEHIRMIFAINMLNEGWDVLSLFDIVKIDEIEKKTIKKSTISETQLIGRGARINPYTFINELNEETNRFKRKFDKDINHELRILEEMNFYSANNNDYINSIKKELVNIGLKDNENVKIKTIKIKPTNELSDFAKFLLNKFVFSNKLEKKYNTNNLISDYDINIQITKDYNIKEEKIVDKNNNQEILNTINENLNIKEFILDYNNQFILNNVFNKLSYYNMNNIISNYKINSKKELFQNILNLNDKISITLQNKKIENLTFNEKKDIVLEILLELEKQLKRKRNIKIGSKSFTNKFNIQKTFKEYSKNENNVGEFNKDLICIKNDGTKELKNYHIKNKDLFYYDNISWDSCFELEMYKLLDENLNSENYLVIRNEVGFKIYNPFTEKKDNNSDIYITEKEDIYKSNGNGFEPDFLVLKKVKNNIYQYFIEVKGNYLATNEDNKWKEKLLNMINKENEIIENNINYKLYGLPFFTEVENNNDSLKKSYLIKLNLI